MSRSISILLVEDSALDAELAMQALLQGGIAHETRRVETRSDFEEALKGCGPDLILSDYSLPGFDGMSALKIAHDMPAEFWEKLR